MTGQLIPGTVPDAPAEWVCIVCSQSCLSQRALQRHVFTEHKCAQTFTQLLCRLRQATAAELFERETGQTIHPSTVMRQLRPLVADPRSAVGLITGRNAHYYWREPAPLSDQSPAAQLSRIAGQARQALGQLTDALAAIEELRQQLCAGGDEITGDCAG